MLRSQLHAVLDTQLPALINLDDSEWNAVVHAYWSGMLTLVHGPATAEGITERHERWGMERGQTNLDLAMDRYNNNVGRDIAPDCLCASENIPGAILRVLSWSRCFRRNVKAYS